MSTHVRLLIMNNQYNFRESIFNTRVAGNDYLKTRDEFSFKVNVAINTYRSENHDAITRAMTFLKEEIDGLQNRVTGPDEAGIYKMQQNGQWAALDTTGFSAGI